MKKKNTNNLLQLASIWIKANKIKQPQAHKLKNIFLYRTPPVPNRHQTSAYTPTLANLYTGHDKPYKLTMEDQNLTRYRLSLCCHLRRHRRRGRWWSPEGDGKERLFRGSWTSWFGSVFGLVRCTAWSNVFFWIIGFGYMIGSD